MATWYVYMDGDNDPGYGPTDRDDPTQSDNWSNAFQALATAVAAVSAGDRIYVAHDHAEEPATVEYEFPETSGSAPVEVICVNRSTGACATTGVIRQEPDSVTTMEIRGIAYIYGLELRGRGGTYFMMDTTTAKSSGITCENCILGTTRTSASGLLILGVDTATSTSATMHKLINCTYKFGHTSSRIQLNGGRSELWGGSLDVTVATPTSLFKGGRGGPSGRIVGMDLTNLSTNSILDGAGTDCYVELYGCKGTYSHLSALKEGCVVKEWSGGPSGKYGIAQSGITGTVARETTVYRSGGAADGTPTDYCFKVVANSYCKFGNTLDFDLATLHADLNDKTVTVYAARKSDAGDALDNSECWIEVLVPDDASTLLNQYTTGLATPRTSAAAYTSTSETWATLSSPYQWKMVATIPAAAVQKGMCLVRLRVAADLSGSDDELYVDPKAVVA